MTAPTRLTKYDYLRLTRTMAQRGRPSTYSLRVSSIINTLSSVRLASSDDAILISTARSQLESLRTDLSNTSIVTQGVQQ